MPKGVIGFSVSCSRENSPGLELVGDGKFVISMKFKGMKDPILIKIPVHGQSESNAGDGDDTAEIAGSADAAVDAQRGVLGKHYGGVWVAMDNGGPGRTHGRIEVDDPDLESLDAAEDCNGKLNLVIVYETGTDGPAPGPKAKGTKKWSTSKGAADPEDGPDPDKEGSGGSYRWRTYLDPKRRWWRPPPWRRRARRDQRTVAADDLRRSPVAARNAGPESRVDSDCDAAIRRASLRLISSEECGRGMVMVGFATASGMIDPFTGIEFLCVPFRWTSESLSAQAEAMAAALEAGGVRAISEGSAVRVLGVSAGSGDLLPVPVIGVRTQAGVTSERSRASVPWDIVLGQSDDGAHLFISVGPSPVWPAYSARQIAVRSFDASHTLRGFAQIGRGAPEVRQVSAAAGLGESSLVRFGVQPPVAPETRPSA